VSIEFPFCSSSFPVQYPRRVDYIINSKAKIFWMPVTNNVYKICSPPGSLYYLPASYLCLSFPSISLVSLAYFSLLFPPDKCPPRPYSTHTRVMFPTTYSLSSLQVIHPTKSLKALVHHPPPEAI
jgi:hypothetical protein